MLEVIDRVNDLARAWTSAAQIAVASQCVVARRLCGLSETLALPQGESDEMIREKAPAFTEAMVSGALTALSGQGPDRVMQAWFAPLSERVRKLRAFDEFRTQILWF